MLEKLSNNILGNDIILAFAVVLAAITLLAFLLHHFPQSPRAVGFSRGAPGTLVTIGLLGTFLGIALGLLDFDVKNIDKSIPPLLEGLKLAFLTSIIGLTFSILLRTYQSVMPVSAGDSGATADDINQVMHEIRNDGREFQLHRQEFNEKLLGLISGESDSTLITQLQKLRTTLTDSVDSLRRESQQSFADLIQEFREFATTMAENNSKALIEALEQVIRDFNVKITEQFGENFKHLNVAVGRLLTWQDQYKQQMETMLDQFQASLRGIDQARDSLTTISQALAPIPGAVEGLADLIGTMSAQTADLKRHLEAFSNLATQAGDAFPEIERRLNQLTEDFGRAVIDSSKEIQNTVQDARRAFEATIAATREALSSQVQTLDREMQEELRRAIEAMGSHLASLSNKFVEDYTPLTDKLREVVEIARGIDSL